jgi:subtilase family serine protease
LPLAFHYAIRTDLTNLLQRLYDPASPDYHQYLTPEQFAQRFGPDAGDYEALADFFKTNGCTVTATHPNRAVLDVRGAVGDIEKLLHTSLRLYPHPNEARNFFAPEVEPSLDIPVPLLHISGLDNLLRPRPMSLKSTALATPAAGSAPGGDYMGNDFRAAYVPGTTLTGATTS